MVLSARISIISRIFVWIIVFDFSQGVAAAQNPESSGIIRGKIFAPANDNLTEEILQARAMGRYPAHHSHENEPIAPYRLSEKAVIYIETMHNHPPFTPPEAHTRLDQRQLMFRPLVLPILAGTTVDFPNDDDLYHNVFSYSQAKEFDLGKYPQGASRSVTFEKPGVVNVYCDIHAYMYATILVLENPYFALPADDGAFEIRHVPSGMYRLSVWYGRKKVASRTVTVRADEATVEDFTL